MYVQVWYVQIGNIILNLNNWTFCLGAVTNLKEHFLINNQKLWLPSHYKTIFDPLKWFIGNFVFTFVMAFL